MKKERYEKILTKKDDQKQRSPREVTSVITIMKMRIMKKDKRHVSIRMDKELYEAILKEAKKEDRPFSWWVVKALESYLNREPWGKW